MTAAEAGEDKIRGQTFSSAYTSHARFENIQSSLGELASESRWEGSNRFNFSRSVLVCCCDGEEEEDADALAEEEESVRMTSISTIPSLGSTLNVSAGVSMQST